MSLFRKQDDHAGSGIDKPDPKGLVEKVVDKVKAVTRPAVNPKPAPAATPSAADGVFPPTL